MFYVYYLRSVEYPEESYIGFTTDISKRLDYHNDGRVPHTSQYKPWNLLTYFAFQDKQKAIEFERYLKSGSGRAFAKKHFKKE